jgi:hypothetical protein
MTSHATFYLSDHAPLSAELLRRHAPGAEVREHRSGLLRRLQGIEVVWPDARLLFKVMDEAELRDHLAGFAGFVHAKAAGDPRALIRRVQGVRQVVSATIEPGPDAAGQVERLVRSLAAERRALVVREIGVFDEHGHMVVDPSGAAIAETEPQVAREPVLLREPVDEPEPEPTPPSAERVLRRALALATTSLRGQLEYETVQREARLQHLREAVLRHGIAGELEPDERQLLAAGIGTPTRQQATSASWRIEGLTVLAWALGVTELPAHDQLSGPDHAVIMRWLFSATLPPQAATPTLRPAGELDAMRNHLLGVHWRLRDFGLHPRAMDFVDFARRCWFGGFDLRGLPVVDGDLAIGGVAIHRAAPEDVSRAKSIALERHQAINWLCGDAVRYSDVDTST